MKTLVIYHKADWDGLFSREICRKHFGDEYQKTTCLWLKNLPPLQHFSEDDWFATKTHVGRGEMVRYESGKVMPKWYADARGDGHLRSRTFAGIANAMADQWGAFLANASGQTRPAEPL